MILTQCEQCKTEFYAPGTRKYCGQECYVNSRSREICKKSKKDTLKAIYERIDELDAKLQVKLAGLPLAQLEKILAFVNKVEQKKSATSIYAFISRNCNGLSGRRDF